MALAEQMRVELVHVAALLPADVALPRIGVRMATLVQEIERLIRESDPAEDTL